MRRVVFIKDKLNKHSVRALMGAFEKWYPGRDYQVFYPEEFFENVKDRDLVLMSFATGAWKRYRSLVTELRPKYPGINSVCGGPHPSARSSEMAGYFDAVCIGEGEISLKDIVDAADRDRAEGIIKGKRVENLDDFPAFPRRIVSLGPIELVRGCPSSCAYCQTPGLFPGGLRKRSVEAVTEEISFAAGRKYGTHARFIAPDASSYAFDGGVNLPEIERLLKSVRNAIGREGKIFFGSFPSELDPCGVSEELRELIETYCDNRLIVLGLQSASKRMRKAMNRRSGIEDAEKAIRIFLEKDFDVITDLIFGLPYEDEESYNETYKFIERWRGKVTIHAHPFDPLPGSPWEYEKPTKPPQRLLRLVSSLEGIGKVFGRALALEGPKSSEGKNYV